jgi:ankyrin repeat protein
MAVEKGHLETVRVLLEHKAQATEPQVRFLTARKLLRDSACHAADRRPQVLHAAALSGDRSVAQLLLQAGATPATQNSAGETALSLAVLVEQWECAEVLLRSPGGARAVQVTAHDALCESNSVVSVSNLSLNPFPSSRSRSRPARLPHGIHVKQDILVLLQRY